MRIPFTKHELEELVENTEQYSLSLYMPTIKGSSETSQNALRFKNLINDAKGKLESAGFKPREIEEKLKPFMDLIYDNHFWRDVSDGLAMFHGGERIYIFKVPVSFKERVVLSDGFHLKQIIPLLYKEKKIYVLSISKNSVVFYEGNRFGLSEIEVENIPKSYEEAFPQDTREKQLQFHTGAPSSGQGGRAAMFHGQGAGSDDAVDKKKLLEYCRLIDNMISKQLADKTEPLILVSIEPLLGIYGEANTSQNLKYRITHNPEDLRVEDLHKKVMEKLGDFFEQDLRLASDNYKQLIGTGKASNALEKIVRAAHYDQIQDLFVELGKQQWGRFDPESGTFEYHETQQPGDKDLLNLAAVKTWVSGGSVFIVPDSNMPDKTSIAATFRFPAAH